MRRRSSSASVPETVALDALTLLAEVRALVNSTAAERAATGRKARAEGPERRERSPAAQRRWEKFLGQKDLRGD